MVLFHNEAGLQALEGLCYPALSINAGEMTFIIGESGCGKSTYLRLLNGTLLSQQGRIYYKGQDIRRLLPLAYRREVLLVPQEVYLVEGTIADNFSFYYEAREVDCPSEDEMRAALALCCADFPLTADCQTMSGGERQRVFLAIFLSFPSAVWLLDEPTAALDAATAVRLLTNIKREAQNTGRSVVCVSHTEALVARFADAVIHLGREARADV